MTGAPADGGTADVDSDSRAATVALPDDIVERYEKFSRFNSPYPAHDRGRAIDLYPGDGVGRSPVAGTVREVRTVGCPDRPYAAAEDHLIVVGLADEWCARAGAPPETVARILHVIPEVEPGDRVAVGDALGPTTRSGFFGQWVDDHVHLGFRPPDANPLRASGSLPVAAPLPVEPVAWDGTGRVVERGPSHVVLAGPRRAADTGRSFAALASDEGVPLDGGVTHYAGGGTFGAAEESSVTAGTTLSLFRTEIGRVRADDADAGAPRVEWAPVDVLANGGRVTGLSLFAARGDRFGVKVVCPDREFDIGESVTVEVVPSDDPIRLGVG
ncbi:hypothetical protein C463_15355 [Halorubrum californiense DSM 19288]|uniref:Uncharacterized protein n=1 Tax=Halorubrum californiense DSM 19288 TaxID=1227465 RepID=M0DZR8_9EURY|nr:MULTISPECIES: hypothetical protein [Halorubrum]ELZ40308.1 hypothetical protein C463_15355 [Halorubrum californiense DSM 19288]TKX68115.1 hypothetical protein EXE40_13320 [Halorubrum sp. GN11GM_10-3_MGM]